jgi:hypothetical protein
MNRPPLSLGKVIKHMKGKNEKQIAVVVGTVTDDKRILEIPKLNVCALRFTASARDRIIRVCCLPFILTPSLPHSLTPSLPHSLTPSFSHSFIRSLTFTLRCLFYSSLLTLLF